METVVIISWTGVFQTSQLFCWKLEGSLNYGMYVRCENSAYLRRLAYGVFDSQIKVSVFCSIKCMAIH